VTEPGVSVVIPVHNGATTILDQLEALRRSLRSAPSTELVLVDNRSTDGTAELVRRWAEECQVTIRVEAAPDRPSEPYARNVGLHASRGEHILYCDADDVVADEWIASMSGGLDEFDFVTGPIRTGRLNPHWLAGVRGHSVFAGDQRLFGIVPFPHGANMGFRRRVLIDLGGFDERFPIACDQALAVRAWRSGVELAVIPDAVVHYRLRPDLRSTFRQGLAYGRFRPRIQALVPEIVDVRSIRRAWLRRAGWAVTRSLPAIWNRALRARVTWVASGVAGEMMGTWELRHDG
jgi:glycosyltransferase involved in cell wall biosynthesis